MMIQMVSYRLALKAVPEIHVLYMGFLKSDIETEFARTQTGSTDRSGIGVELQCPLSSMPNESVMAVAPDMGVFSYRECEAAKDPPGLTGESEEDTFWEEEEGQEGASPPGRAGEELGQQSPPIATSPTQVHFSFFCSTSSD